MSDVFVSVTLQRETQAALLRQVERLKMLPKQRFTLARKAAREVKKYSAARVRGQRDLEGSAFAPRSAHRTRYRKDDKGVWRKKRRLLENLGKAKNMVEYRQDDGVVVSWKKHGKKHPYNVVAHKHQYGMTMQLGVTPEMKQAVLKWHAKLRRRNATRKMAQALKRHGFKLPVRNSKGKIRLKSVPVKWIQENMNQMRAAWLLRMLVRQDVSKSQPRKPKPQTWKAVLPARSFLGVSKDESELLLQLVNTGILEELKGKK